MMTVETYYRLRDRIVRALGTDCPRDVSLENAVELICMALGVTSRMLEKARPKSPDELRAAAERTYRRVMRHRGRYLRAWIAATGLLPTECEIVEQPVPGGLRITIRRRVELQPVPETCPGNCPFWAEPPGDKPADGGGSQALAPSPEPPRCPECGEANCWECDK
jgi:hypothetical protein